MSEARTRTSPVAITVAVSIRAFVSPAVLFDTSTMPVEEPSALNIAVATEDIEFETVALMRLDEIASTLVPPATPERAKISDRRICAVAPAPGIAISDDNIGSPINTSSAL